MTRRNFTLALTALVVAVVTLAQKELPQARLRPRLSFYAFCSLNCISSD